MNEYMWHELCPPCKLQYPFYWEPYTFTITCRSFAEKFPLQYMNIVSSPKLPLHETWVFKGRKRFNLNKIFAILRHFRDEKKPSSSLDLHSNQLCGQAVASNTFRVSSGTVSEAKGLSASGRNGREERARWARRKTDETRIIELVLKTCLGHQLVHSSPTLVLD